MPVGFWDTLFMELRRRATSGTISACIQTLFLLSAKIQILLTTAGQTGGFKLIVRASTRAALEVAKMGLDKSESFYRGMVLWAGERKEMSADMRAAIIEPAQVLVLMAGEEVRHGVATSAKSKKNQVVDAGSAPRSNELDKKLLKAFKKGDTAGATELLQWGADPFYTASSCCFVQSSLSVANKSTDLQRLLLRFSCDDADASTMSPEQVQERLKQSLQEWGKPSKPRLKLTHVPGIRASSKDNMEWIETLCRALDANFPTMSISRAVFSPHW